MATPFDCRHAIGLRHRLRVVQDSAVVVGAEVFERFLSDSLPLAYSQSPRRNDIQPPLGFLSQGFKRRVHGPPISKNKRPTLGSGPMIGAHSEVGERVLGWLTSRRERGAPSGASRYAGR